MIHYFEIIFIYLACFYKWQINNKKVKIKDGVVKKAMKDSYKLGRSSLLRAEKPRPKIEEINNIKDLPIELENLEDNSSYN